MNLLPLVYSYLILPSICSTKVNTNCSPSESFVSIFKSLGKPTPESCTTSIVLLFFFASDILISPPFESLKAYLKQLETSSLTINPQGIAESKDRDISSN